jgi:hypothetical protein
MEGNTMTKKDAATESVREYVRGHRNREFVRKGNSEVRSKPLSQIAEELELRPAVVRDAMRECGWFQAITDAERAGSEPTNVAHMPKFRPWGPVQ